MTTFQNIDWPNEATANCAFVLLVSLLLAIPVALANRTVDVSKWENRRLAPLPALCKQGHFNRAFFRQADAWINDRTFGRKNAVSIRSGFLHYLDGRLESPEAYETPSGWMFLHRATRESFGISNLTSNEIKRVQEHIAKQSELWSCNGGGVAVFVAPNKSTIYEEFASFRYSKRKRSSVDRLIELLSSDGRFDVVWPRDTLELSKPDGILYYKDDTHWTGFGAYVGFKAFLRKLGIVEKPIPADLWVEVSESDEINRGDLARMLGLPSTNERYRMPKTVMSGTKWLDDGVVYDNPNALDSRSVLVVGDSFREPFFPWVASSFRRSLCFSIHNYDAEKAMKFHPQIIVWLIVERNVKSLPAFDFFAGRP